MILAYMKNKLSLVKISDKHHLINIVKEIWEEVPYIQIWKTIYHFIYKKALLVVEMKVNRLKISLIKDY